MHEAPLPTPTIENELVLPEGQLELFLFDTGSEELRVSGVRIEDLEPYHCRWPFGDPQTDFENFRYCGEVRGSGSVYCAQHRLLGTNPLRRAKTTL